MVTTEKTGIARLVHNCAANGMTHVVCSPGSRNAALIIAIDNHPEITAIVIHDERSAAFYALGMSQQLNLPVGLICTSGSAVLNYFPAVAEAYYQCIPLVIMSADRPTEWINHGDGQTIMQDEVFGRHVRSYMQIEEYIDPSAYQKFDRSIRELFEVGNGLWKGPIHINCPISEPMYDLVELDDFEIESDDLNSPSELIDDEFLLELEKDWNASSKRMIVCGQMDKNIRLLNRLSDLANDNSVVVLVENTSNLIHPKFIHCIDRTLSGIPIDQLEDFEPDLLISLGGAIISKRIKTFLRKSKVKSHWRVGHAFPQMDTYRKLTRSICTEPAQLIDAMLKWKYPLHINSFGLNWKKVDYTNKDAAPTFVQKAPYSDFSVIETLLDYIPDNTLLHMGNSSLVRYCQLFDPVSSIQYFSNRGTSGIDGSTSAACGAAFIQSKKLNVLITGDVSFFYDSNALWSNYLSPNLRIVVINNSGGGIFRIIDGPSKSNKLEKYFETQQPFSAEKLCATFDVDYLSATSIQEIETYIPEFFGASDRSRPVLLEIHTPKTENDKVLKDFFEHFKQ